MTAHTDWSWLRFEFPRENLAAKASIISIGWIDGGEATNIVGEKVTDQWRIEGSQ